MVAVLWHQDNLGGANIIGVFESEQQARDLVHHQHGPELFASGHYNVTMRPLTRYRGDVRLWP